MLFCSISWKGMCLDCIGGKNLSKVLTTGRIKNMTDDHKLKFGSHALEVCHLLHLGLLFCTVMTYDHLSVKPYLPCCVAHSRSTVSFAGIALEC